jgi:hypothetical protein
MGDKAVRCKPPRKALEGHCTFRFVLLRAEHCERLQTAADLMDVLSRHTASSMLNNHKV